MEDAAARNLEIGSIGDDEDVDGPSTPEQIDGSMEERLPVDGHQLLGNTEVVTPAAGRACTRDEDPASGFRRHGGAIVRDLLLG